MGIYIHIYSYKTYILFIKISMDKDLARPSRVTYSKSDPMLSSGSALGQKGKPSFYML